MLIISLDLSPKSILQPKQNINIVNAVAIDKKQVEKELQRLKQAEQKKQETEKKRLEELEKKAKDAEKKLADAEKKRVEEEQKLADTKKKKEQEQQKRELEEQKLAKLEKEKEELEKKRKLEEEHKRQEAADKALKEALAAEEAEVQSEQAQELIDKITADIYRSVVNNFNKSGLPQGLSCVLRVQLIPGGEVTNVTLVESSGNSIFDQRSVTAVEKASPFQTVPDDVESFERLGLRQITFRFIPEE
ncbi:MAG: cell envelope integrity protein TolA [Gammaproteobacteria bacterium]|nr:cell envelope integrity protein TolA [Gammaproteobacteria bacterium]